MNSLPLFAKIPLLDWSGPEFLKFYGFTLILAIVWSWVRTRTVMRSFETRGVAEIPTDPYELAYLAAGEPRVLQLTVACLIQKRLIHWKSNREGKRLIMNSENAHSDVPAIEEALLQRIYHAEPEGIRLRDVGLPLSPCLRAIEVKMAAAGLRPTASERNKACIRAIYPLIFLGIAGGIKMFVGLSRGKPVGFLLGFLLITFLAACIIGPRLRRLTPTGERLLAKLRGEQQSAERGASREAREELPVFSHHIALFGTACLISSVAFAGIHDDLKKHFGGANGSTPGGGCGTGSSGCGSSGGDGGGGGCGGGGCGGGD